MGFQHNKNRRHVMTSRLLERLVADTIDHRVNPINLFGEDYYVFESNGRPVSELDLMRMRKAIENVVMSNIIAGYLKPSPFYPNPEAKTIAELTQ